MANSLFFFYLIILLYNWWLIACFVSDTTAVKLIACLVWFYCWVTAEPVCFWFYYTELSLFCIWFYTILLGDYCIEPVRFWFYYTESVLYLIILQYTARWLLSQSVSGYIILSWVCFVSDYTILLGNYWTCLFLILLYWAEFVLYLIILYCKVTIEPVCFSWYLTKLYCCMSRSLGWFQPRSSRAWRASSTWWWRTFSMPASSWRRKRRYGQIVQHIYCNTQSERSFPFLNYDDLSFCKILFSNILFKKFRICYYST